MVLIYPDFVCCECLCDPNFAKYNHESKTLHFLDWNLAADKYAEWCIAKKGGQRNNCLNGRKDALKRALECGKKAKVGLTAPHKSDEKYEKIFYIKCEKTSQLMLTQVLSDAMNCLTDITSTLTLTPGLLNYQSESDMLNISGEKLEEEIYKGVETLTSSSAADMEQRGTAISQLWPMEAENCSNQGGNYSGALIPTPLETVSIPTEVSPDMSLHNPPIEKRNDHYLEQEWAVPAEVGNLSQDSNGEDLQENARLTEAAMDAENLGTKRNNRISVFFIGQDHVGKTSVKKRLMGKQIDLEEPSTVGIEVDIVEVEEKDKAKPWQRTQHQQRMVSNAHVIDAISKDAAKRARGSTTEDPQPASGTNAPKTLNDSEKSDLTELGQQDKTKLLHDRNSSVPKREKEDRNRDSKESSNRNRLTPEMLEAIKEEMKKVDQYDDDDMRKIRLLLHDVAGQSLFYDVHSIFLRLQSLFVLVVGLDEDLSAKAKPLFVNKKEKIKIEIENYLVETNLDYANRWMTALHSIRSLNKESEKRDYDQPATILVLTKPDTLTGSADDIERNIQTATDTLLDSFTKYQCRPHIVKTCLVQNTKSDGGETELREVIFDTCQEILKSQDKFPINWLRLERGLATVMTTAPYIEFKEVEQIGEESGVDVNLAEAVEVLHEQNVIVHFHDDEQARNLVVLDPQWLVNLFSRIITIPRTQTQSPKHAKLWERLKDHGELSTELLSILLGEHIKHKLALTSMMERVKLICQWDKETWLVPSMAQATKATKCAQDLLKTCRIPPLYVYFEDGYVLLGLFTRLQVYFIRLSKSLGKGIPRISCDFSCIPLTHGEIEYSIILVQHVTRIQVAFTSGKAIPEHELLEVASKVKYLLQEGLNEIQRINPVYRSAKYHFAVKCDCGVAERKTCHRHQQDNCSDEGCVHHISIERLQNGENGCNRLMGGCDIKQFGPWLDIQVETRDLICQKPNEETQEISVADDNSVVTDEQTDQDATVVAESGTSQFLNGSLYHELQWKWEQNSEIHKAKYQLLLEHGQKYPDDIKEINGVRVCCNSDFLIGKGCDGTCVYIGLAKDGCEKAVKRLLKDVCAHLGTQEKKILNTPNAVNSKYVVRYWYYDETDKAFAYLIEDLCEETLKQYVAKRRKEDLINEAPAIVRQILEGLSDLQCDPEPVLHRDLKPSNIMRNVSGNWLLADFGISRTLAKEQTTHRSEQKGTKLWRAVESYPPKDESDSPEEDPGSEWVRYKKKSDIQVAGMIAFYILTKGKHPFGCEEECVRNLRDGNPVCLAKLLDPVANDLISWMLQHKPEDRPSAKEALKHPYLQPADKQFELLYCVGNEPEIKTTNSKSDLVSKLNNDPLLSFDWKAKINPDVMKYFCTDEIRKKEVKYGCEWTECLRLIRNTTQHWNDRPHPRPEAHSIVGNLQKYFLKLFPTLPVVIHRIIRSSERKETLQKFFM